MNTYFDPGKPAAAWMATSLDGFLYGEIVCVDPFIIQAFYTSSSVLPLAAVSAVGPILRDRAAHMLIMLHWSIEPPNFFDELVGIANAYLADHPHHQITFLCNVPRETEMLQARGFAALTINHNCLLNDAIFKPKPEIEPVYDAVYNACIATYKRHELAAEVEKLALIYYHNDTAGGLQADLARVRALLPKARFVNELTPDGPAWISGPQVNDILAQSRVGLCLSWEEGAMRASAEYMFAGLSVVSTPALGGRDFFFDDEYCIITEPDPRSVREAVEALVARNVPRDHVRSKTLERIDRERQRYIDFVQGLIDRGGGGTRFNDYFWQCTRHHTMMRFRSTKEFCETVTAMMPLTDRPPNEAV